METNDLDSLGFAAFEDRSLVARGGLAAVAMALKARNGAQALVFDERTGRQLDLDLSGSQHEVLARLPSEPTDEPPAVPVPRGPGRPKLGVVAREITLLPRHWEWLGAQPGGASVALRRLIDAARKSDAGTTSCKAAREAVYRFLAVMAGNEAGFEEAMRSLFAGRKAGFFSFVDTLPADVGEQVRRMARDAFPEENLASHAGTSVSGNCGPSA